MYNCSIIYVFQIYDTVHQLSLIVYFMFSMCVCLVIKFERMIIMRRNEGRGGQKVDLKLNYIMNIALW